MQQAKESLGQRMIRKSGHRSSEKVMRNNESKRDCVST
jgi:hypothetical protein